MTTVSSGQIVEDFENSFQACLAALTNPDHFNVRDSEEVKTGVEQTIQRFLDVAKQMECFFLQKRLLLSVQKPEHIILENNNELKSELARKEQLLKKYYDKIPNWQNLLKEVPGGAARPPPPPQGGPPQQQPQQGPPQQGLQPMVSGPPMPNAGPPLQQGAPMQSHPHHMIPPPPHMMPQQGMNSPTPVGGMMMQNPQMHGQPPHMGANPQQGSLQGPLAYLERTMSNIGIPDGSR